MRRTVVDLLQRTSDARDDDIMTFVRWVGGEGGGGVAGIMVWMMMCSRVECDPAALRSVDGIEGKVRRLALEV